MTPRQAFREHCRTVREFFRRYRRSPEEAAQTEGMGEQVRLLAAMGQRLARLADECMRRIAGEPRTDMFPEHRRPSA